MPLIKFKLSNCKIPHLKFVKFFQTINDKNYEKNYYLGKFVFLPPFPLLTMLRNNEQNLRQAMLWVRNIV